jgi:transketolase
MSDGECNEGSVWEAALFAPAHKLENLTAVIDFNKWQATGRSCDLMALEPLRAKWEAFGWHAVEIDGHDLGALVRELGTKGAGKPKLVVAHTVKGKGVSFMEDDNNWHYRIPDADEYARAMAELAEPIAHRAQRESERTDGGAT